MSAPRVRLPLADPSLVREEAGAYSVLPEAVAIASRSFTTSSRTTIVIAGPASAARDAARVLMVKALTARGMEPAVVSYDQATTHDWLAETPARVAVIEGTDALAHLKPTLGVLIRSNERAMRNAPLARQVLSRADLVVDRLDAALANELIAELFR